MNVLRHLTILSVLFAASTAMGASVGATHSPNPTFFQAPIFGFHISRFALLTIGFAGQMLFSARVIAQAWSSHQRKESYMPPSFWYFSLAAATLLIFYCFVRSEPVGLLMQALMSALYLRNIYLIRREANGRGINRTLCILVMSAISLLLVACVLMMFAPVNTAFPNVQNPQYFLLPFSDIMIPARPVLAWGFIGSAIFMGRFFVQWLASERVGRSIVPTSFWIMASVGSVMLLFYFLVKSDPVNLVGQLTTLPAYIYNLSLIRAKRVREQSQFLKVEVGAKRA